MLSTKTSLILVLLCVAGVSCGIIKKTFSSKIQSPSPRRLPDISSLTNDHGKNPLHFGGAWDLSINVSVGTPGML